MRTPPAGDTWKVAPSGLIVPNSVSSGSTDAVAGESMRERVARTTRRWMGQPSAAEWLQGLAAVAALLVSVVALTAACSAQSAQNSREASRYASRVSAWIADAGGAGSSLDVKIQNRAPIPIHLMFFYVDYLDGPAASGVVRYVWTGDDIPPCSIVELTASPHPAGAYTYLRLMFREGGKYWLNDDFGVHRADALSGLPDPPVPGREVSGQSQVTTTDDASDCGVDA
jgi:hypothetical protein